MSLRVAVVSLPHRPNGQTRNRARESIARATLIRAVLSRSAVPRARLAHPRPCGITEICGVLLGSMLLVSPLQSAVGAPRVDVVVIANKAVSATRISRDELRPIFQTKKNTWPDGTSARPFNLTETNPVRRAFDAAVLGLDPDRVARYWIDRKIRGGDPAGERRSARLRSCSRESLRLSDITLAGARLGCT